MIQRMRLAKGTPVCLVGKCGESEFWISRYGGIYQSVDKKHEPKRVCMNVLSAIDRMDERMIEKGDIEELTPCTIFCALAPEIIPVSGSLYSLNDSLTCTSVYVGYVGREGHVDISTVMWLREKIDQRRQRYE